MENKGGCDWTGRLSLEHKGIVHCHKECGLYPLGNRGRDTSKSFKERNNIIK